MIDDFPEEMRGFSNWNIKKAEAELEQIKAENVAESDEVKQASKKVKKLKFKLDMVNELLEGPNLDRLFAQDHKIDS